MKKDFKQVADNLSKGLGLILEKDFGMKVGTNEKIRPSVEEGLSEEETRATFIVKKELLEKIKDIAYWERVKIKDIINLALEEVIAVYEKNNNKTNPRPASTETVAKTIVKKRVHKKTEL
jgi:hypothetical protein